MKEEETASQIPVCWFDYKGFAIDEQVYYIAICERGGLEGTDMGVQIHQIAAGPDGGVYVLGECVSFNHQPLYISAIDTELEGAELYHPYTLAPKAGLQVPKQYNLEMIGNSLSGKITATQKAVVQVSIDKDENEEAGVRWLPYATVYSTPDGTGWYCMPEVS